MSDTSREEAFLNNISARLGRQRPISPPSHPFRGAPDIWSSYQLPPEERIKTFMAHWQLAGGHAERLPDLQAAAEYIAATAGQMSARSLVRHDDPLLNAMRLEQTFSEGDWTVWNGTEPGMKEKAAAADIGIIAVDYAVAQTGSLVTLSGRQKGRSVSLLPTMLIALIPVERLKTRLGEVMPELDLLSSDRLPAGVHFISGPSRSADIENDLTIGVHGPGIVHALIIG